MSKQERQCLSFKECKQNELIELGNDNYYMKKSEEERKGTKEITQETLL